MNKIDIYNILVNKENSIPEKISEHVKLITFKDTNDKEIFIEEKTYLQYEKLKKYIYEEERTVIGIGNAYRTAERQKEMHQQFILWYGKEYADAIVAPVNHSEHQTGLAIDLKIYFEGEGFISNNRNFEKTRKVFEAKIHKHLYKFGFILRYPNNKENITKYPYEPWHIRYVGEKIAKKIYDEDITFEEYKSLI